MSEVKPTISPSITFQFEKMASWICDEAKIDYADRPYQIREWIVHLERSFRALVADERTLDEDAALVAIALFNPWNVVKQRLGGVKRLNRLRRLWYRLLYYHCYSVPRLVIPVVYCMFHCALRTSGSAQISVISTPDHALNFVLFGWGFYIGIIMILVIVLTRWINRKLNIRSDYGQGFAGGIGVILYFTIVQEWLSSVSVLYHYWNFNPSWNHVAPWKNTLAESIYLGWYAIEAIAFVGVIILLLDEIFEFPSRRRLELALKRSEISVRQ